MLNTFVDFIYVASFQHHGDSKATGNENWERKLRLNFALYTAVKFRERWMKCLRVIFKSSAQEDVTGDIVLARAAQ